MRPEFFHEPQLAVALSELQGARGPDCGPVMTAVMVAACWGKAPTTSGVASLVAFLLHEVTRAKPHIEGLVTLWPHHVALGHIHPGHPEK